MAKSFQITGGHEVIVDDDLYPIMVAFKWHLTKATDPRYRYACRRAPYGMYMGYRTFHVLMHRIIVGAGLNDVVHHINGNTLDNRRENLQIVRHHDNLHALANRKFGNEHPKSKFTDDDIKEILRLRATGMSFRKIGDQFCVGHTIIRNICIGKRGKGSQIKKHVKPSPYAPSP